jgi:tetratricopeptide (TPR) repeat protein
VLAPLKGAEEALERGDRISARAILSKALSAFPKEGKVHYLLGHIDFAEEKYDAALEGYRHAIVLDASFRGDPALLRNASSLLADKEYAEPALVLLSDQVGVPACAALERVAVTDRRPELRHRALTACERLRCGGLDRFASYLLDLQTSKTCPERKEAMERLRKLGDKRALEPFKKALRARGGFLNLSRPNDCMGKELKEAIKELEG